MRRPSLTISALALGAALMPGALRAQDAAICEPLLAAVDDPEALGALAGGLADPLAQLALCAETLPAEEAERLVEAMGTALDADLTAALGGRATTDAGNAPAEGGDAAEAPIPEEGVLDAEAADLAAGEDVPAADPAAGAALEDTGADVSAPDDGTTIAEDVGTADQGGALGAEAADLAAGEDAPAAEPQLGEAQADGEADLPASEDGAALAEDAPAADPSAGVVPEDANAEAAVPDDGTAVAEDVGTADEGAALEAETAEGAADEDAAEAGSEGDADQADAATDAAAAEGDALPQTAGDGAGALTDEAAATAGTDLPETGADAQLSEGAAPGEDGALGEAASGAQALGTVESGAALSTGDDAAAGQLGTGAASDAALSAPAPAPAEVEAPQADTEETAAAANAVDEAAAARAAEAADAPMEDAETVTVTEETARSATEEVTRAAPAAEADEDDLTPFQRALLLGLGAVAVGTVLQGQGEVVSDTGDRVVVRQESGALKVLKDDDALLRRPGAEISTQTFDDGSSLTRVVREDGSTVVTVRTASGQVLRRTVIAADGTQTVLFDDLDAGIAPVDVADLPDPEARGDEVADLRAALSARDPGIDRRYSLQQVRQIRAVRQLAPVVDVNDVTFDTGSAVIRADQAEALADIGDAMREAIAANPGEVFLVEGHTDAVGSAQANLALSDRRAESVALALTEFFGVPPENMVVQGYGESNLRVVTGEAERANRRAAVRRITPLLRGA